MANSMRTSIEDLSACGESLSDAEMRLISGGEGETCTADENSCDQDGTPSRPSDDGLHRTPSGFLMNLSQI